jgi:hypothetical protein
MTVTTPSTDTNAGRGEIARRGRELYEQRLRSQVESDENIGKMLVLDVESGDYEIDELGIESARKVRSRHPNARLFGIRIGYRVAESFGGVMERTGE